ncbi:TPA: acyltransferase [Burkholderia multivorans]|nr:acyltransferase [Burkholderia multivorans]HDR9296519.1 acyltransferase [Burkholderia multivorans]HDR9302390.1 acyltransferase [Burkholderia multivorans]HDR9307984.1 acyltransferase [Burkholderia multivorans]HDR9332573.1 acyltransferase [Burkholderia multivorans]
MTSLRFFAAAAVVFAHFGYVFHTGGIGVAFFFMLSGFVLSLNYGNTFLSFSVKDFSILYLMRLARIYPLHIVTMLMSLPLWIMRGQIPSFGDTVSNLTLTQSWHPIGERIFGFNGVAWTLSVEWFFYLMLPMIIFLMHKTKLSSTKIGCISVAFFAFSVTYGIHRILGQGAIQAYTDLWWLLNISPILHVCTFIIGVALGQSFVLSGRSFARSPLLSTMSEVLSLSALAVTYAIYLRYAIYYAGGFELCFLPSFALLIITFSRSNGFISRALSIPIFVRLGEISFSIYMIHQIIIFYFNEHAIMLMGFSANPFAQLAVAFLTLGVAEIAFRFVEDPSRRFVRRLIQDRRENSGHCAIGTRST